MNWAYVAGFTDGDGCITRETSKGQYHYARLRWAQKAEERVAMKVRDHIRTWIRDNGRDTFRSVDFIVAAVLAVGAAVAAGLSVSVRSVIQEVLFGQLAVGVALLSVVLASLAILVVLIDKPYRDLLQHVGGVPGAMVPYKTVALLAMLSSVASLIALVVISVATWWVVALAFSVPTLFTVWSIIGTAQLAFITAGHVADKADLIGLPGEIEKEVRRQRGA